MASLEMFRRSGDDLLDRWDGRTFLRTIAIGGLPCARNASWNLCKVNAAPSLRR